MCARVCDQRRHVGGFTRARTSDGRHKFECRLKDDQASVTQSGDMDLGVEGLMPMTWNLGSVAILCMTIACSSPPSSTRDSDQRS
jgi:hypothetical protein